MTDLIPMELTETEQRMILERRAEEAHAKLTSEFREKVLLIANDFYKWAKKEDEGFTFSTFVNQFGYDLHDCKMVYTAVGKILELVRTFDIPKEKPQC